MKTYEERLAMFALKAHVSYTPVGMAVARCCQRRHDSIP